MSAARRDPVRLIALFLTPIGRGFLAVATATGRLTLFTGPAVSRCFVPPFFVRVVLRQMIEIGYYSLPVVGLTALFTGMVLALQSYTGFARFNAEGAIANVVVLSMTRELGPVLTGLMVAGRVGAAMAAELGTMRVTEQIDALRTLATHPVDYLVVPRLVGTLIAMPLLTAESIVVGIAAGYLVGVYLLRIDPTYAWANMIKYSHAQDVLAGLTKALIFGGIIATVSCYKGMNCPEGVGRATTEAVVYASISILISNFFLTLFLTKLLA